MLYRTRPIISNTRVIFVFTAHYSIRYLCIRYFSLYVAFHFVIIANTTLSTNTKCVGTQIYTFNVMSCLGFNI